MSNITLGNYRFDSAVAMIMLGKGAVVVAIILVTWLLAKAARWSFAALVDKVPAFGRPSASGESLGSALGRIVSLLIWLFGLVAVLQSLGLTSVIGPVQGLLNSFMAFIPKIIGAGVIFFVGLMIARIVRDIVTTAMATVNFDKWANKGGAEAVTGNSTISQTIGTIVYVMIIIPVAIAALDVLNISAITVPAREMLETMLHAVPLIIGACLLLGLGFVIARFVGKTIEDVLPGLGFDRSIAAIGVLPEGRSASGMLAKVAQIAIMLFMGIAATRLLGFPELTRIVQVVLDQGASVLFGAVLIAVGVLIARLVRALVTGAAGAGPAPALVYWLTVGLFVFIGLKQMNIGGAIVDYAFVAIAVGTSIAFALAVGLGGRDVAARKLNEIIK